MEPATISERFDVDLIPDRVRCFYGSADPLDPYGSIVLALEGYESPFGRSNVVMTVQLDLMDLDGRRLLPSGSLSITLPDDATLNECADLLVGALTSGVESLTGEELLVEVYAEDAYHLKVVVRPRWVGDVSRRLGGLTVCLIEPEFVPAFETVEMNGDTVSLTVETHVGFTYTLPYREGFSRMTPWRPVLTLAGDDTVHTLTYTRPAGRGFFRLDVE